jgi:hypothetical protein
MANLLHKFFKNNNYLFAKNELEIEDMIKIFFKNKLILRYSHKHLSLNNIVFYPYYYKPSSLSLVEDYSFKWYDENYYIMIKNCEPENKFEIGLKDIIYNDKYNEFINKIANKNIEIIDKKLFKITLTLSLEKCNLDDYFNRNDLVKYLSLIDKDVDVYFELTTNKIDNETFYLIKIISNYDEFYQIYSVFNNKHWTYFLYSENIKFIFEIYNKLKKQIIKSNNIFSIKNELELELDIENDLLLKNLSLYFPECIL